MMNNTTSRQQTPGSLASHGELPLEFTPFLVVLSFLVSCIGCGMTLLVVNLAGSSRKRGVSPKLWLFAAASSMGGIGIWSMHFIGMAAVVLPIPIAYDPLMTVASFVVAVLMLFISLNVVMAAPGSIPESNQTLKQAVLALHQFKEPRLLLSGVMTGAGVLVMHYTGMAAMRLQADMSFDPVLFAVSCVLACVVATVGLFLIFFVGHNMLRFCSAFIMATAVTATHYTGMAAAKLRYNPRLPPIDSSLMSSNDLALVVALSAVVACLGLGAVSTHSIKQARDALDELVQQTTADLRLEKERSGAALLLLRALSLRQPGAPTGSAGEEDALHWVLKPLERAMAATAAGPPSTRFLSLASTASGVTSPPPAGFGTATAVAEEAATGDANLPGTPTSRAANYRVAAQGTYVTSQKTVSPDSASAGVAADATLLGRMLDHPVAREMVKDWAQRALVLENVMFLLRVRHFKSCCADPSQRTRTLDGLAQAIMAEFVFTGSAQQLNLSNDQRISLEKRQRAGHAKADMFDDAVTAVERLFVADPFQRFAQSSPAFKPCVTYLRRFPVDVSLLFGTAP